MINKFGELFTQNLVKNLIEEPSKSREEISKNILTNSFEDYSKLLHENSSDLSLLKFTDYIKTSKSIKFSTFEIFEKKKLLTLYNYLSMELYNFEDESNLDWFYKNSLFLFQILNYNVNKYYFLDDKFLYRKVFYKPEEDTMGRLYAETVSIQFLPREIRYYLFENIYQDFDMVNAQFANLYMLSKIINVKIPNIIFYIENRDEILQEKSLRDKTDLEIAKKRLIIAANSSDLRQISKLGFFANKIFEDVLIIREKLYDIFKKKDKKSLSYITVFEGFGSNFIKNKNDFKKLIISLQSNICRNIERNLLLNLYSFIQEKIDDDVQKMNNNINWPFFIEETSNNTIYDNIFSKNNNMSFVPFFDGAYIYAKDAVINKRLESYVNDFNNYLNSNKIRFKKKSLITEFNHINIYKLKKYELIDEMLKNLSFNELTKLLKEINITPIEINLNNMELVFKDYKLKDYKILDRFNDSLESYTYKYYRTIYLKLLNFSNDQLINFKNSLK
jgi:hypothetical protein